MSPSRPPSSANRENHISRFLYGLAVDPYEIEDISDGLGCPTPLETCPHQLRMLENEIEELTPQLRQARQNIIKLVEMHAEAVQQRDEAMANLRTKKSYPPSLRGLRINPARQCLAPHPRVCGPMAG